jgi:hypothetical protein
MIRRLRQRHRWMIVVVALAALAVFSLAIAGRTPPRRSAIPAALQSAP